MPENDSSSASFPCFSEESSRKTGIGTEAARILLDGATTPGAPALGVAPCSGQRYRPIRGTEHGKTLEK